MAKEAILKDYEVIIEDINPCGGLAHARRVVKEVQAESPEAYVKANSRFPILMVETNADRETVVDTGDGRGNFLRFTFSEC